MNKKVILMILDGWGTSPDPEVSAIDHAKTPYIDALYTNFAHASLRTDGLYVGLPEGQMGNSEVGHMNLGAGRIVYQDLAKINLAVTNKTLAKEVVLKDAITYAKSNNKPIHLLGLLSDGGVHSHINHLFGLIDTLEENAVEKIFIHAFTDGRDVDPKSGLGFISKLQKKLLNSSIKLASVCGRYYSMDRDNRWERIKLAYDALVNGVGIKSNDLLSTIKECYNNGITDEFLKPIIVTEKNDEPIAKIKDDDVVLFLGNEIRDAYLSGGYVAPATDANQNWTLSSSTTSGSSTTVVATRALNTGDNNDYVFTTNTVNIPILWAYGSSFTLNGHANRGGAQANFTLSSPDFTQKEFGVYPNPTIDELNFEFPQNIQSAWIHVYNVLGKQILHKNLQKSFPKISTTSWVSGLYVVQIVTEDAVQTQRIIKQ